ncbi:MAG TPA: hypothetical protein VN681_12360 [Stellaceae bacterium]|nr:hypothetical protein [Stellaceae bacterium]
MAAVPADLPAPCRCPHCGAVLDGASAVNDAGDFAAPSFGDISVCFACGGLVVFDTEMRLDKLAPALLMRLGADERAGLLAVQRAVRLMRAEEDH